MTYLDTDKIPDTIAKFVIHKGVLLESRYRKSREFIAMASIVDYAEIDLKRRQTIAEVIKTVFCDSKASCCYEIVVYNDKDARMVGYRAHEALFKEFGGYNSIVVYDITWTKQLRRDEPMWNYDLEVPF